MKNLWRDILACICIALLVSLFLLPLFYPIQKLLVTPDFGKSDSWHFSIVTKYILWQNLRQHSLPLWEPRIGDGFPLFAEGQIGTLYLPNLILFSLPDFVMAYNLTLVMTIVTLGWGTYVLVRHWQAGAVVESFFAGITMAFAGLTITQLPHITLLQGFSLLPWILVAIHRCIVKPSAGRIGTAAFAISQQIFAGFPQASFITILFALFYTLFFAQRKITSLLYVCISIALAAGLSAVQLLPSYEFLQQTPNPTGLAADTASYFSFPLQHVTTLISPFLLGNPKLGTYPHFINFNGSIFWENIAYIGIIPLVFAIYGWSKKTRLSRFLTISMITSFLLMWGGNSPFYIIYSLWPFNLFRVPSRFLWVFLLSLTGLSALGTQTIRIKFARIGKIITTAALLVHLMQLFFTWRNYHLLVPATDWLTTPNTIAFAKGKIMSIGSETVHNSFFLASGWTTAVPYDTLRGSLANNSNLFWDIPSRDAYAGRFLRRSVLFDTLLSQSLTISQHQATLRATAKKLLDISSVRTLVSAVPVDQPIQENTLAKTSEQTTRGITIATYDNPQAVPRAYIASGRIVSKTLEEAAQHLVSDEFVPGQTVITESDIRFDPQKNAGSHILHATATQITVRATDVMGTGLLVLSDSNYPGWNAYIDSSPVPVYPINIKQRGVLVPEGNHIVNFLYEPKSFSMGAAISAISAFIVLYLVVSDSRDAMTQPAQTGAVPRRDRHSLTARARSDTLS